MRGKIVKCHLLSDSPSGFSHPENIALASRLELLVRTNGGIPATIGVLNGIAKVGFAADELVELLESPGRSDTKKLSRRDLAYICGLVMFTSKYPCWSMKAKPNLRRVSKIVHSMVGPLSQAQWS